MAGAEMYYHHKLKQNFIKELEIDKLYKSDFDLLIEEAEIKKESNTNEQI